MILFLDEDFLSDDSCVVSLIFPMLVGGETFLEDPLFVENIGVSWVKSVRVAIVDVDREIYVSVAAVEENVDEFSATSIDLEISVVIKNTK